MTDTGMEQRKPLRSSEGKYRRRSTDHEIDVERRVEDILKTGMVGRFLVDDRPQKRAAKLWVVVDEKRNHHYEVEVYPKQSPVPGSDESGEGVMATCTVCAEGVCWKVVC